MPNSRSNKESRGFFASLFGSDKAEAKDEDHRLAEDLVDENSMAGKVKQSRKKRKDALDEVMKEGGLKY